MNPRNAFCAIPVRLAIDSRDATAEAPVWDEPRARLLWSDLASGVIHEARSDDQGIWRETRRWNLGRSIGAAIPRQHGGFVAVAGLEVLTVSESGATTLFASIDDDARLMAFNDAKCDFMGRLWSGTVAHDLSPGRGALYRIDPDGLVTRMLEGVTGSNGLDWSPDGSTFYYVDSFKFAVDAFDVDPLQGTISNRRTLVAVPPGQGLPDGMTVDEEGCLWIAVIGKGVHRYSPQGELLGCVELAMPCVTSCAFGGIDHRELLITTTSKRAPDSLQPVIGFTAEMAQRAQTMPGAGGIFVCRPGPIGRPAHAFAG